MDSEGFYPDADLRRCDLQDELDTGRRLDGGIGFLQRTFGGIFSRRTITQFLAQSKIYDLMTKRWRTLPEVPPPDFRLGFEMHQVLKETFKYKKFANSDRKLVYCRDCGIDPRRDDLSAHEEDPTFMVLGRRGMCFEEQHFPTAPTFAQCVSFIKLTSHCNPRKLQSHITLMATYARQCFIDQPTRLTVYAALLTGSTMWLIQYDRGGVTYSTPCDIHDDPHTFIRIILGIASSEAQVGFDTSIFWEEGKLWIRTRNQKGRRVVYLVKGNRPIEHRNVLVGRATRCWRVIDPYTNKEYVLKEIWRLVGDEPEANFLENVRGLPSVGQLVAVEEDPTKTTSHFRGYSLHHALPTDRIWCRMTLESYSGSLDRFTDGLQLLEAYKDIVLAVLALWERDILHRDISIKNTLLGMDLARGGSRGVLIDFDRAARIDTKESLTGANPNIGTRTFQSSSVLRGDIVQRESEAPRYRGLGPYPHDHLDDMESLFYLLCWVCYHFDSPGILSDDFPDSITYWDNHDPSASANAKLVFLMSPLPPLSPYFQRGLAYQHLLERLQKMIWTVARAKREGTWRIGSGENLKEAYKDARQDFDAFIGYIDEAIEEWSAESSNHTSHSSSEQQKSRPAKRANFDDHSTLDEPSPKRRKTASRPKPSAKAPSRKQPRRKQLRS